MEIMQNRLDREFQKYQQKYEDAVLKTLRSGCYILGENVSLFEKEFAFYIGSKYAIGVASGLDALWIAFRALGIGEGDEVIVQANTYIASVMGITINGAAPKFVEPDVFFNLNSDLIEKEITPKTKAILVVHLYGQAAQMDRIVEICQKYNLYLIEDCAQAHGAKYNGQMVGTFGNIGCFSFYPSKNLGAFGDGGAIVTNDQAINDFVKMFRNYGSNKKYHNKVVGANSRLDEIQASLLRVKLQHLHTITQQHRTIAESYFSGIKNKNIILPQIRKNATCVWHQYVVRCKDRDRLAEYLEQSGIKTGIHYPIPPHLSEAYRYLNYQKGSFPVTEKYAEEMLSLPIYIGMSKDEQNYVIQKINEFI